MRPIHSYYNVFTQALIAEIVEDELQAASRWAALEDVDGDDCHAEEDGDQGDGAELVHMHFYARDADESYGEGNLERHHSRGIEALG